MKRIIAVLAFASGVSGCQGVVEPSAFLSQVHEVVESTKCPIGGTVISNGKDLDGDGTLSAAETTTQTEVCSGPAGRDGTNGRAGANAPVPLFKTTMVRAGDANCAAGGVRIDFGYDAVLDGGSGDGVLGDDEIRNTEYACNGAAAVYPQSTRPPPGDAGASIISVNGGDSVNGDAGSGGGVSVKMAGTLGGNIKLFSTGSVDAGFEVPAVTFERGPTPLQVTSDLTLRNFNSASDGLASGDEYFQASGTLMQRVNGQGLEVSSVDVGAGVTLTTSGLYITGDVRNAGTIRGMPDYNDFAALNIIAKSFSGLQGSMLVAQSDSRDFSGAVYVSCPIVVNQGHIIVSGFDRPVAGAGGRVQLTGKIVVNTGLIEARGGAGREGGPGGRILMSPGSLDGSGGGEVSNSGALDASGGGGVVTSGAGGHISLVSASRKPLRNSGSQVALGGSCNFASTHCTGGEGGRASFSATGGDLLATAAVDVSGGRGAEGSRGAAGGQISFLVTRLAFLTQVGSIRVSGALMADGSNGCPGGAGGLVDFELLTGQNPKGEEIELLGYASIFMNGGNSTSGIGGSGGSVSARMFESRRAGAEIGPTGAIVSNITVTATGGDGRLGGRGGSFSHYGPSEPSPETTQLEFIVSEGQLNLEGGAGKTNGGEGGTVGLMARGDITLNGRVNLEGSGLAGSEGGGSGGALGVLSLSALHLRGEVLASGGTGRVGGGGGRVWVGASPVDSSARFDIRGGHGGLQGGAGGSIEVCSYLGQSVFSGESLMSGGSGAQPGQRGRLRVDGHLSSR